MGKSCNCILNHKIEVPYRGTGDSRIMFVGESPGRIEEIERKPFKGDAGKMLYGCAADAGLDMSDVRITNSARCLIDKKQLTPKQQRETLAACRHFLVDDIARIKPKLIILLGDFALRQVTKAGGITKKRGQIIYNKEFNTLCLPTFHPAYILRNRDMRPYLVEDLSLARRLQEKGFDENALERRTTDTKVIDDLLPLQLYLKSSTEPILIALDTETQGWDFLSPDSYMISFSIAYDDDTALQVFLHGLSRLGKVCKFKHYINVLKQLRWCLEHPNSRWIMQNGNYDKHHLLAEYRRAGLRPPEFKYYVLDIQAGAHLINENRFKQASLEQMRSSFLGEQSNWKKAFYAKVDPANMIAAPRKLITEYAGEDANATLRIGKVIIQEIKKDKRLDRYLRRLSMPVISQALFTLHQNGVFFNRRAKPHVQAIMEKTVKEKYQAAINLVPEKVVEQHRERGLSFTRRDFVSDILFSRDGFDLEPPKLTGSGKGSTDYGSRIQLIESRNTPSRARQFLVYFDEWSEWAGVTSKGIKGLEKHIRADGRIHANYTTTQAVTGRVSATSPNVLAMPKRSKAAKVTGELISAEDEERVLIEADLSQAELRYMAHASLDKELIRVYQDGEDVHTNTAKALSTKPWDKMSDEERKSARTQGKAGSFGLLYGMHAPGFVAYCLKNYQLKVSLRWAERYIDEWFTMYPGVRAFHGKMEQIVVHDKRVRSMFGRIRHLPDIDSQQYGVRNEAIRQAINFPIQSSASDHALFSLVHLIRENLIDNDNCKPVLFIHDALVFSVKKDKALYYGEIIKDAMENAPIEKYFGIKLRVPIVADVQIGNNRSKMVEMSEWKP